MEPRRPPSVPISLPQPPIRAGSRLRVWRSFLLENPLAEAVPPDAGEEQEKTLCSRLWADISERLSSEGHLLFSLLDRWRL